MTLDKDSNRPFRGNNRKPMKRRTAIIFVVVAVLVIAVVVGNYLVRGGTLF